MMMIIIIVKNKFVWCCCFCVGEKNQKTFSTSTLHKHYPKHWLIVVVVVWWLRLITLFSLSLFLLVSLYEKSLNVFNEKNLDEPNRRLVICLSQFRIKMSKFERDFLPIKVIFSCLKAHKHTHIDYIEFNPLVITYKRKFDWLVRQFFCLFAFSCWIIHICRPYRPKIHSLANIQCFFPQHILYFVRKKSIEIRLIWKNWNYEIFFLTGRNKTDW